VEGLRGLIYTIEGLFVAFIGRPLLWLIKFFRWQLLIFGFFFNSISKYDPVTKTTTSEITYIPMIVGIILFAIGTTISRYDELVKEFYRTYDERPDA